MSAKLRFGIALLTLTVFAVSTFIGYSATFSGIVSEELRLTTSDGVRINGRTYRPSSPKGKLPAVVVCHGFAASLQTLQNMFSVEFARRGFYVIAIDLRGHGDSGGSLPAFRGGDFLSIISAVQGWPLELAGDVRAAIDYLSIRNDVDHDRIALVGHSLGGGAVLYAGFLDPRVKAVVAVAPAVSAGSAYMNASLPRNLLLAVGGNDAIIAPRLVLQVLNKTLGGCPPWTGTTETEVSKLHGSFSDGTARKMIISPGIDHVGEMFDTYIAEEAVRWVEAALNVDSSSPVSISSDRTILMFVSALFAIVLPFPALSYVSEMLGRKRRGLKYSPGETFSSSAETSVFPRHLLLPALLYLAVVLTGPLLLLLSLVHLFLRGFWFMPVMFGDALLYFYFAISFPLLICLLCLKSVRRELQPELTSLSRFDALHSVVLGATASSVLFLALNTALSWGFIDLLPTPRELTLMLILFPSLLPMVLVDEAWLRGLYQRKFPLSRRGRVALVIAVYMATRVSFIAPFTILASLIGFLAAFLLVLALLNAWIFEKTQNVVGGAILTSFLFSWALVVVMPFT